MEKQLANLKNLKYIGKNRWQKWEILKIYKKNNRWQYLKNLIDKQVANLKNMREKIGGKNGKFKELSKKIIGGKI